MEPISHLPERLLTWYQAHHRDLPWRQDREPYHVWVSEIMLQQTRVEAVKGYYARFLSRLPTVSDLAEVPEPELLKLWEGLGYYTRARNLKKAAIQIMTEFHGKFPRDYAAIRSLPGIGDYTAGAISSICFEEKTPAVDGNVLRVVSRICDDHRCTDDPKVKRSITSSLAEIYPEEAGEFTQSLMELGAMVCLPNGAPLCDQCPMMDLCLARMRNTIAELPVRKPKKPRRQEDMTVFLLSCGDKIALERRPDSGLLAGLYQFPHLPGHLSSQEIIGAAEGWGLQPQFLEKIVFRTHIFTHIQWNMLGARLHCAIEAPQFLWVDKSAENHALPTAFRQFLPDFWEEST